MSLRDRALSTCITADAALLSVPQSALPHVKCHVTMSCQHWGIQLTVSQNIEQNFNLSVQNNSQPTLRTVYNFVQVIRNILWQDLLCHCICWYESMKHLFFWKLINKIHTSCIVIYSLSPLFYCMVIWICQQSNYWSLTDYTNKSVCDTI